MKKNIAGTLGLRASNFWIMACFTLGASAIGTLIFELIMRLEAVYEEAPTTTEMGTLCAVVAFVADLFLFAMLGKGGHQSFNMAVSMSRTRKNFFISNIVCSAVTAAVGIACILFVSFTEHLRLTYWWGEYPCETNYRSLPMLFYLLFMGFAFICLSQFMIVLFLRYGKHGYFVLWILWMVCAMIVPRIISDTKNQRQTPFAAAGRFIAALISSLPAAVWMFIAFLFLLLLLAVSYRMFLRQQVTT